MPLLRPFRLAGTSSWGTGERTAVSGTSMFAAALGAESAPLVVCVHGLGCSHRYFEPLARSLAPDARVVAVDLPGFGRTPGPARTLDVRGLSSALGSWLRATGRGGSVLLGNSSGCQVIVDLAVHAPELLGPVVLAGPTFDSTARTAPRQVVRLLRDQPWERRGLRPLLARDWLVCGPRRYLQTFRFLLQDPVEDKLPHVRTPTLVVRGSRDRIAPRRWVEEMAERLPAGRSAEVPGAGHTLNWSAPQELARLVRPLLARTAT